MSEALNGIAPLSPKAPMSPLSNRPIEMIRTNKRLLKPLNKVNSKSVKVDLNQDLIESQLEKRSAMRTALSGNRGISKNIVQLPEIDKQPD